MKRSKLIGKYGIDTNQGQVELWFDGKFVGHFYSLDDVVKWFAERMPAPADERPVTGLDSAVGPVV